MLAIGCGISDGLGFGCNGRAALITRGLSEMTRLAVMLGAHPLTMQGLAGMGDLVLTCTGERVYLIDVRARDFMPSSRNCAAPCQQRQSAQVSALALQKCQRCRLPFQAWEQGLLQLWPCVLP